MVELIKLIGPNTTVRITVSIDGVEIWHEVMDWDEYERRRASHSLPGEPVRTKVWTGLDGEKRVDDGGA